MTEPTTAQAATETGAPSRVPACWHAIDWRQAHRNVRRLQMRIVKATQEGKWGKVKALQHLLTHSFSGKVLAIKRVTENDGKRTLGVDKVRWTTPEQKMTAVHTLRQRGYHPQPLRRVSMAKSNGKQRPLGIPCMKDRAMQVLYSLALDPVAETNADPNSYGFRKERCPADAIEQGFQVLAKSYAPQWIREGDIQSCCDKISHEWLESHIPMERKMLRKWLKAGYMEKKTLHPTEDGTPQGGPISPTLANMTLDGLERRLREKYPNQGPGKTRGLKAQVNFIRFADDFVITGATKELLEQEVKPLVEQFMSERGLTLSQEKTCITHINEGVDFLGQTIRKYHGTLLITPSKKKVKAFLQKVRTIIQSHKAASAGRLIQRLNPVIQGGVNYHRHVVSTSTFHKVDHAIFQALWQWAKRRHPNKAAKWIREKYFRTINGRAWCFVGETMDKDGTLRETRLVHASETPMKRHRKIRALTNPYDPAWEVYLEERLGVKMGDNLTGKRGLLALWKEQGGLCPICNQKITKLTGWHNHHIVWRVNGGTDEQGNRVLLHPNCHRQVHSQHMTVVKPRPTKDGRKA